MTVKKQKGRGIRRGDTNAQRRAASRENRRRLYGPRPENWTSLPSHKWGGGSTDLKLAEIYRKQGIPLPRDLQDRADYAFRQKKKTKLAEVNAFRAKYGITPRTKLSKEGMEARNVEMAKKAEEEEAKKQAGPFLQSNVTKAPEQTSVVSTEKPPGLAQELLGTLPPGLEPPIGVLPNEFEMAETLVTDPRKGLAQVATGTALGLIDVATAGIIRNLIVKAPSKKIGEQVVNRAAAGFIDADTGFIKQTAKSTGLKKSSVAGMVGRDRTKLETAKYLKPEWDKIRPNTKSANLLNGWLGKTLAVLGIGMFATSIIKDAINSIIMGGFIGKEEAPQTLNFAFQKAKEMDDVELMEEINKLHNETLITDFWDNVPWISSYQGIQTYVTDSRKSLKTNEKYVEWLKSGGESQISKSIQETQARGRRWDFLKNKKINKETLTQEEEIEWRELGGEK